MRIRLNIIYIEKDVGFVPFHQLMKRTKPNIDVNSSRSPLIFTNVPISMLPYILVAISTWFGEDRTVTKCYIRFQLDSTSVSNNLIYQNRMLNRERERELTKTDDLFPSSTTIRYRHNRPSPASVSSFSLDTSDFHRKLCLSPSTDEVVKFQLNISDIAWLFHFIYAR